MVCAMMSQNAPHQCKSESENLIEPTRLNEIRNLITDKAAQYGLNTKKKY